MNNAEQMKTTTGMYGKQYVVFPNDPHTAEKIRTLAEKGRESMRKRTNGHKHCLITKPSRSENLALMVAALGWENARSYIAMVYHRIGSAQPAAATLHVPEAVIWAVLLGTFPGEIAEV
jgi:hypothetical protein